MKYLKKLLLLGAAASSFATPNEIVFAETIAHTATDSQGKECFLTLLVVREADTQSNLQEKLDSRSEKSKATLPNVVIGGIKAEKAKAVSFSSELMPGANLQGKEYEFFVFETSKQTLAPGGSFLSANIGGVEYSIKLPGSQQLDLLAYHGNTSGQVEPFSQLLSREYNLRLVGGTDAAVLETVKSTSTEESKIISEFLANTLEKTSFESLPAAMRSTFAKPEEIASKLFFAKVQRFKSNKRLFVEIPAMHNLNEGSLLSGLEAFTTSTKKFFRANDKVMLETMQAVKLFRAFGLHQINSSEPGTPVVLNSKDGFVYQGNFTRFQRFGDTSFLLLDTVTGENSTTFSDGFVEAVIKLIYSNVGKTLVVSGPTLLSSVIHVNEQGNQEKSNLAISAMSAYPTYALTSQKQLVSEEYSEKGASRGADYQQLSFLLRILEAGKAANAKMYYINNDGKENSVYTVTIDGREFRMFHTAPITGSGYAYLPEGIDRAIGANVGGKQVAITKGKVWGNNHHAAIEISDLNTAKPGKPTMLAATVASNGVTNVDTVSY